MNARRCRYFFSVFLVSLVCVLPLYLATEAQVQKVSAKATVQTRGGLRVASFDTLNGRIIVNLPNDMAAGDTISGTVAAEPKGNTEDERSTNANDLSKLQLRIMSQVLKDRNEDVLIMIKPRTITNFNIVIPPNNDPPPLKFTIGEPGAALNDRETVLIAVSGPMSFVNGQAKTSARSRTPSTLSPNNFILPPMGQQGRTVEIFGPFDGNWSNTSLKFQRSAVQDFEKNTENVSGGFGLIAESPRKAVFMAPTNVSGPVEIILKEGNVETQSQYRNVGVNLSAPKTNLLKGESTTMRVEVAGLQGIKEPVPLTLDSKGVITMEGGMFQPVVIQPSQVAADGRYTTTREITGVETGGWTSTATVVVQPFTVCLQDDSVPARVVLWNTFTGDYIFACPGCSRSHGQTTTDPYNPRIERLASPATGKVTMKGCMITLQHNAPDRRVFAKLDNCTQAGSGAIEVASTRTKFTITDRNVADNTCSVR